MSVVDLIAASAREVASRLSGAESRAVTWEDVYGSTPASYRSRTGVKVTQDNSVQLVAVWACVSLISDAMASTPLRAYSEKGDLLEPMAELPSWLKNPNMDMQPYEFWTRAMTSVLLDGNSYFLVLQAGRGIVELQPLHPTDVEVQLDPRTNRRTYRVRGQVVDRRQLLHVPGLVLPGEAKGLSPIGAAKEAIGLGMAAEQFGGYFFSNAATTSGVIETPGALTDDQARMLARQFGEKHTGLDRSHLPGVLTGGAQWKPITIPPDQAQFLETRKFQTAEIARLFRVPPHLIGDVERSTSWGSGIEEQNRSYLQFTLSPWVVRFEQALSSLMPQGQVVRFDMNQILRGTKKERYETYNIGVQGGFIVPDEARAEEGLPPLPDGAGAKPRPAPNESPDKGGASDEGSDKPAPKVDGEDRSLELRHPGHADQSTHGSWAKGASASVGAAAAERLAAAIGEPDGGFTFDPRSGKDVSSGYALSPFPERSLIMPASEVTPEVIKEYVAKNADLLDQPDMMLGGWHNPDDGNAYLDVSIVMASRDAAAAVAAKYNQIAMFHLDTFTTIATGGTGKVA